MSQAVRRAVIDVGTNSVKLLIADVVNRDVRRVLEESRTTRLGRGFYENHLLQPIPIAETALAVGEFARTAKTMGAGVVRAIATSAARDARNAGELADAVQRASGLSLEIISGEQEAELAFQGATSDSRFAQKPILLLDVGGGSTELILGQGATIHYRESFPIGAVRLMERVPHREPPLEDELEACRHWMLHFLEESVRPRLAPALRREVKLHEQHHPVRLVGTGGAATVLARIIEGLAVPDSAGIEVARLPLNRISAWVDKLWALPLSERRMIPGLPADRADVILTGSVIYEAIMRCLEFEQLHVTTRGLRFAALMFPSS